MCIVLHLIMVLKTIAISQDNYELLKDFGRTGDSFNDVITNLIRKGCNISEELQSDSRHLNHSQTVANTSTLESVRPKEM
jgi:predicted CopG family antitoxin